MKQEPRPRLKQLERYLRLQYQLLRIGGQAAIQVYPIKHEIQNPASPAEPGDKPSKDERLVEAIQDHEADYVVIAKGRYVPMWEKLDREDPDYAFDMRSPDGGHSPMLIADATMRDGEAWFDVYLPVRPNGSKAWLRAEDVRVQQRYERIEVDLSKRTLEHFQDGELVDRFKVGVG